MMYANCSDQFLISGFNCSTWNKYIKKNLITKIIFFEIIKIKTPNKK